MKRILIYRKFFGDPQGSPVMHDGIEVGGEEVSMIYYCKRGQWLELRLTPDFANCA